MNKDNSEEEIDTGPDFEEAMTRFKRIKRNYNTMMRSIERNGIGDEKIKKTQAKLVADIMEIKLAPKQVDMLWNRIKDLVELVRGGTRKEALQWLGNTFGIPMSQKPLTVAERARFVQRRAVAECRADELTAWRR